MEEIVNPGTVSETRELVLVVRLQVGPLVAQHSHATGTTFAGWTPGRVGQAVANKIGQSLRVGDRIHGYEVGISCSEEIP